MWTTRLARLALVYVLVLVGVRITVAAPVGCEGGNAAASRAAAGRAADWAVANQAADGTFAYLLDDEGRDADQGYYSHVRHAGVTLALYQAARALEVERYRAAADRALDWMIDHLHARDGWRALSEGSAAPLGGSALMLAALAERRELTGERRHDALMRDLGRFLVAQQRDDGGFRVSLDLASGRPDTERTSPYFPGEALWALARLDHALPDETWRTAVVRAADFLATKRDQVEHVRVPPLNDHWASYGFAEMAATVPERPPVDGAVVRYSRRLYARFSLLIRWQVQRDAGRLYALTHGPVRQAAAVGTWLEGQAALARLAARDTRLADLRDETTESSRCAAALLVARQRRDGPVSVRGAWFADGITRMDDQQHAISGLLALADLLDAEDAR